MRFMIQKRLLGGATSGIVIVLLVLISSGFSLIQYTPATSWRSQGGIMMSQAGFANELYVNIQPATPIANYQIRLNLNATFNYAACQADGRDIRFFDGINVLSFWTEQWNVAGNSIIWIRIPIASTTRITMAYGNATIGSASNGNATFPLFDDFSGSSFNVSKWTVENDAYSTTSVSGGLAQLHSLPPSPTRMITFLGFSDLNVIHGSNSPNATTYNNAVDKENEYENALNAGIPTSLSTGIIDSWTVLDYAWTNTSLARFSENDTSIFTATTNVPSMALPVVFAARGISYGLGTHYAAIIRSKTTFGPGHEIRALAYYQYDGRLTYPCLEAYVHVAWVAVRNITTVESVAMLGPAISVQSPSQGQLFSTSSVALSLTVQDPYLHKIWYKLDGGAPVDMPTNTTIAISDGTHTIVFYANETSGAITSVTRSFTVDSTAPVIIVQSPTPSQIFGNSLVSLGITATDTNLDKTWYTLDNGSMVLMPVNTTITVADGMHSITFYANDTLGHVNSVSRAFSVDTTAPTITVQSPVASQVFGASQVPLTATFSDSNLDKTWYRLDNGSTVLMPVNTTITVADGMHLITFYANDTLGHVNSVSRAFSVDTTAPTITVQSPVASQVFGASQVPLTATFSDSNLDKIWYRLDNGSTVLMPVNTTITVADGMHSITFYANDTLGHVNSVTRSFIVDTAAPVVSITSPVNASNLASGNFSVLFTATDLTKDKTWYTVNGGNPTFVAGSNFPLALADGSFTIIVYCNDSFGRISASIVSVTIDSTAPSIAIDGYAGLNIQLGDVAYLNWTLADVHPATFELWLNGQVIKSGTYASGSMVSVLIDASAIGQLNYTMITRDTFSNVRSLQRLVSVVNRTDGGIFLRIGLTIVNRNVINLTITMSHWSVLYLNINVSIVTGQQLNQLPSGKVIALPVVFNINIRNGSAIESCKIRITYNQQDIASQINEGDMILLRMNANTGSWDTVPASISKSTNYVEFTVNSNGLYVIASTPKQNYIPIIIIVLIGITGGIVAVASSSYRQKHSIKVHAKVKGKTTYQNLATSTGADAKRARLMQSFPSQETSRENAGTFAAIEAVVAKKKGNAPAEPDVDIAEREANARTLASEVKVDVQTARCIVHKGIIEEFSYTCKTCGTVYCMECVLHLASIGEPCWTCKAPLSISQDTTQDDSFPKISVTTFTQEVWDKIWSLELTTEIFDEVTGKLKMLAPEYRLKYLEDKFPESEQFDRDF